MLKDLARTVYRIAPLKPRFLRALRKIYQPPERIYRHLHFEAPFSLDLPNGARMQMHHFGNQVENDLFWSGFGKGWEKVSLIVWLWLNEHSNVVLDIGANTGIYALSAFATRPEARVVAIEPVTRIHAKLMANFKLNRFPAEVLNIAASDLNGRVRLYDPGGKHAYSASLNVEMLGDGSQSVEIDAKRLDDLASDMRLAKLDVLKIDVEMHEPEVIAGGLERIATDRPAMLIEILNAEIGNRISEMLGDYIFYEIGHGVRLTENPGENSDRNYLLLHKDDVRLEQLGGGVDLATIEGWIKC